MPTANRDGRSIFYRDEGKGLPVLLLHGFPLTSECFAPQLRSPPEGVRLLVPDHRGFGKSAPGEGPLTMEEIARDALAVLDALGIQSAVVGGVSMGGYAALALTQLDPSRVRGLLLIDTQMGADDAAAQARREDTARALEKEGIELLVRAMLPKLLAAHAPAELKNQVAAMIRTVDAAAAAQATRGMALRHDSREILHRFAGPAVVVVGEEDAITPVEKAKAMADLLRCPLEVVAQAAHLPQLEQPRRFEQVMGELVARVGKA